MYKTMCFLAIFCFLACAGCGSTQRYDDHAGEVMTTMAEGKPLPEEEAAGRPPAPEGTNAAPLLPPPRDEAVVAVKPGAPAPSGANPPDFLQPKPEKVTSPVEIELTLAEGQTLAPGGTASIRFSITPLVNAAEVKVRYEIDGPATAVPAESNAGSVRAKTPLLTTTKVTLAEGRSEVRAWAEGYDAQGAQVFARSEALYFIVEKGKVLAGPNNYRVLEMRELERQRDAGEVTPEEFKQRMRIYQYGGAETRVQVTPPAK